MADTQEIDRLNRRITRLEHQLRGLTGAGGAGTVVTDHGALTGLADDDHGQYHNDARANTWLGTKDSDDLAEGVTNLYYNAANIATTLHGAALDAAPLDADEVPGLDSSASFALIRTTWTSIKAFLKTYFDTLYVVLAGSVVQTITGIKTFSTRIDAPIVRANSVAGLRLEDDGGNLGLTVQDGGHVAIGDSGAWTPTIYGSTTPGSPTYQSGGSYIRIGKLCFMTGYIAVSNVGTMAGYIYIGGLPFVAANNDLAPLLFWYGLATAQVHMALQMVANTTTLKVLGIATADVSSNSWSNVTILDNSCEIDFSFLYITT